MSDSYLRRLKNNPVIAILVVIGIVLIGVAQFTGAISTLFALFPSEKKNEISGQTFREAEPAHAETSLSEKNEKMKKKGQSDLPPLPSQGIVNSPGSIQAGGDVIISPNLQQSPTSAEQSRHLSKVECDTLGALTKKSRVALHRLVAERASEGSRADVLSVQNELYDWLTNHLGAVHAEDFLSAEPWKQVPANYPSRYGGLYQETRGRLTHLTSLASRYCQ